MDMTRQQITAIRSPCFEAEETAQRKFAWRALDPCVSMLLTMNIGME